MSQLDLIITYTLKNEDPIEIMLEKDHFITMLENNVAFEEAMFNTMRDTVT